MPIIIKTNCMIIIRTSLYLNILNNVKESHGKIDFHEYYVLNKIPTIDPTQCNFVSKVFRLFSRLKFILYVY